jgi:hypothetical protein
MARNRISDRYAALMVQGSDAHAGAVSIGTAIPLLINTAGSIQTDLGAAQAAQLVYKTTKSQLQPLSAALRAAREQAYQFCFSARDLLKVYCGRDYNQGWLAIGFNNTLEVPRDYAGLRALLAALQNYFGDNQAQENAAINITAVKAEETLNSLQSAHNQVVSKKGQITSKRQLRDLKVEALRRRLSGLCKELSQRLGPLDSRWREFGFNLPGAPTVPATPRNVVVTALAGARLQVACDACGNATRYRFFYQRPIEDPEPHFAGTANDPLFVTEPLEVGQTYLIYVSAVNEGAESELSEPVSAVTVQAAAA